jgi:hypothetical protein
MKNILILLMSVSFFSVSAKAEEVFYCTSELATGYFFKDGSWRTGTFEPKRWTLKFNADYTRAEGFTHGPMNCTAPYSTTPHVIFCVHNWGSHDVLIFNKTSKDFEFSNVSVGGYAALQAPNAIGDPDSTGLFAGSCQKF